MSGRFLVALLALVFTGCAGTDRRGVVERENIQPGVRPYYLISQLEEGPLKDELERCKELSFDRTDFSIGHRGACLMFPEHTKESYEAAARQGAGILECDVTFTKDRELVCRHAQCDLHHTTNILQVPELAAKCRQPFVAADPEAGTEVQVECCTSDLTVDEFKSLCGIMEASRNANATSVDEYLSTPGFRTDLYATCGTLMTHEESIELFKSLGAKFTPELKSPQVEMPFEGEYTQEMYAQQLIDEYVEAGISPAHVWAQSFNPGDVFYWIQNNPAFGQQAVYLDGRYGIDPNDPSTWEPSMAEIAAEGVQIIAPPMWMLVTLDASGEIVPSAYAVEAERAGMDIITWTLERSGPLADGGGWYFQTITEAIDDDGDTLILLDVLAKEVGVIGVFSDWPGTVTYYAKCMGL